MKSIPIYQVDAFSDKLFGGNPAAVCPLDAWPDDLLLQKIAAENNLSETAFYVDKGDHFHLRWFTPSLEVELCGHATLSAAHVLFSHQGYNSDVIRFQTLSGELQVKKSEEGYTMDFPSDLASPVEIPENIMEIMGTMPKEAWRGKFYLLLLFENESQVASLNPDFIKMKEIPDTGVIATAKGDRSDFVSRFFGPNVGVNEDPVTGSAHAMLTPYWSSKLGKTTLSAIQVSERTGYLHCVSKGPRVEISGKAITFMEGTISL